MSRSPESPAISVTIERPCLYLVGTPIGNLEDVTLRALSVLRQVDVVLAEDTRNSKKLLDRYGLSPPLEAFHQHNEAQRARDVATRLFESRLAAALISDAGTPLISDPGYLLVQACHAQDVPVRYIPGASAILGALTLSGLPCDRFTFEGFLPARHAARIACLEKLDAETRTMVFFEAPHRVRAALADLRDVFGGERRAAVVRELTKLHETVYRGSLEEVLRAVAEDQNASRGEIVLVVGGADAAPRADELPRRILKGLLRHVSRRDAVEIAAEVTGGSRNSLYAMALEMSPSDE